MNDFKKGFGTRLLRLLGVSPRRKTFARLISSYPLKEWLQVAKPLRGLVLCTLSGICFLPSSAPAQSGIALWTNSCSGSGNSSSESRSAVAVDSSGNVYVTGPSYGSGTRLEYATVAYSSTGLPLWTNYYAGTGNYDDCPKAVVAEGGNVYVTGFSSGDGSSFDYATLAYSGAGTPLWTNRYRGPDGRNSWPWSIAADKNNGNVYVTGSSATIGTASDYLTIAYSSSGAALWTNRYGGSGHDAAVAVAVAGNGDLVVTGTSDHRYVTIKYSSAGVPMWTNFSCALGTTDNATGLALDSSGNAYVTGWSLLYSGGYIFTTIAYSSTGTPLWTNRYDGPYPGEGDNFAAAVAADGNGQVYVTGLSSSDYVTIAYSAAGVPLWTNRYDGPGQGYDEARTLAPDGRGNVYVTGLSYGSSNNLDFATIAYSSTGVPLWTNLYNGTGNGDDVAQGIALDNNGNLIVTGSSVGSGSNPDFVTIKYAGQNPSPVPIPIQMQLLGNELHLSWTNASFHLQSAPSPTGLFTNVPGATSPHSEYIIGPQRFFRLKW